MILASLKNTAQVEQVHPLFKVFFDYVKQNNVLNMPLGNYEICGDKLFIINTEIEGKTEENAVLEGHEKYIDIQLLLQGSESLGWKAKEDAELISQVYDAEKDLMFYADAPDDKISLKPGQFMVFFSEDLHAPGIADGPIRKVIAKVKIN